MPPLGSEADALAHLLDVTHDLVVGRFGVGPDQDGLEEVQRQAGAVVRQLAARPRHDLLALKVALLADVAAKGGGQVGRVDDRLLAPGHGLGPLDVELARPVASLAADGVPLEGRQPRPARLLRRPRHPIRVAKQAFVRHHPIEPTVLVREARRDVPDPLPHIPRNGRLDQLAIALQQERKGMLPRAQHVADLPLVLGDDGALGVASHFSMEGSAVPRLGRVVRPLGLEQLARARDGLGAQGGVEDGQGSTHRMLMIRLGDAGMASGAGGVPHELHARPRVEVRGRDLRRAAGPLPRRPGDPGPRHGRHGKHSEHDPAPSRREAQPPERSACPPPRRHDCSRHDPGRRCGVSGIAAPPHGPDLHNTVSGEGMAWPGFGRRVGCRTCRA